MQKKKGKKKEAGRDWWKEKMVEGQRIAERESTGEIERNRERESIDNIFIIYIYTHTNIHPYFCRI